MYTIENHLLHLHKGAGLNRDARRGKQGRCISPCLPLQMQQQRQQPSLFTSATEAAEATEDAASVAEVREAILCQNR